jgi:hypothetical protein
MIFSPQYIGGSFLSTEALVFRDFLDIVRKTKTKSKRGKAKAMRTEDEIFWKTPKK